MSSASTKAINLFIYGDSLAFRRPFQPDNFGFCYPFQLASKLEASMVGKVNLFVRSRGGVLIGEMLELVERDCGYFKFRADKDCINIAVIQLGVVDCAPVPFTFPLRLLIGSFPWGGKALELLQINRPFLQKIWSYSRTSEKVFINKYRRIVNSLSRSGFMVFCLTIPEPSPMAEARSPGFSEKTQRYSELIAQSCADLINVNNEIIIRNRSERCENNEPFIIQQDGHHLTIRGHFLFAELLFKKIVDKIQLLNK